MLKSKFPLSRSSRNDTGLVTQHLDTKTFLRANRHPIMPIDDREMTLTLKINNNQHFKCVLLDSDSILGRVVSLKWAFLVLESSAKDFCFDGNMKQNIQPIAFQENAWMWIKINYFALDVKMSKCLQRSHQTCSFACTTLVTWIIAVWSP